MHILLCAALLQEPIATLVGRLSSERVEEREQASKELGKRGEPILPELEKRLAEAPDAEVRGRLQAVIRGILVPPETRAWIDGVTAGRWSWYGEPNRPALRDEMLVGIGRELRGAAGRKEAYARLAGKGEPGSVEKWKSDQEAIAALQKEGAAWCLASGLLHSTYLVQLECARALADLKDRRVAPVLLDVARALAVTVEGSKSATVHGFRQSGIAKAIDRLLGTSAAWPHDGQNTEALVRALDVWRKAIEAPTSSR